jgi:uncharacterized membrane protein YcaP (DUF421 family)
MSRAGRCLLDRAPIQVPEPFSKGVHMFFNGWPGLYRTVIVGVCAYVGLILLLRISGKRTLSKMNAFDFVITVALGSTLATILLSKETALAEGLVALALLIFLQFAITWLSVRSRWVRRSVKAEPRLLFHKGEFLANAMKAERINEGEIVQAMRSQGIGGKQEVEAVVLESDGTLSIMKSVSGGRPSVLTNVSET